MSRKQVIKLKKTDLDRILVGGLRRSAWEVKKSRAVLEKVHPNRKRKKPKHKKSWNSLEE